MAIKKLKADTSARIQSSTPSKIQAFNKDEIKKIVDKLKSLNFKVMDKGEEKGDSDYYAELLFEHKKAWNRGVTDRLEITLSGRQEGNKIETYLSFHFVIDGLDVEDEIYTKSQTEKSIYTLSETLRIQAKIAYEFKEALKFLGAYVGTNKLT